MSYYDFLRDPRWIDTSGQIKSRDGHKCRFCNSDSNLNVHHIIYRKNLKPWEYEHNELLTLCKTCHEEVTESIEQSINLIRQLSCFPDAAEQVNFLLSQVVGMGPYQIRTCGKIIRNMVYLKDRGIDIEKYAPGLHKEEEAVSREITDADI